MGAATPPCPRRGLRLSLQLFSMPRVQQKMWDTTSLCQGREIHRFCRIPMTELFLAGLVGALLAAGTASLAFPLVNRIAMAVRAVDYPGGRGWQREPIPRCGGLAIAAGLAAGAA